MSTEFAVTKITHAGIMPATGAIDLEGNWFLNTGRCFLYIEGVTGTKEITINSQALCNYGEDHDVKITPSVSTLYLVGPFPKSRFDDAAGKVQITYTAEDDSKIQVIELP